MVSRKLVEGTKNKVQLLFPGKNYTQIRTALHEIAFSWMRTVVLKKNDNVFTNSLLCCTQLPGAKATNESKLNLK